jgi:NTE family protein
VIDISGSSERGDSGPRVVLVLQGGGALGAYEVGAYQALEEGGLPPDWVAGISIGAINAALIAGNPPDGRMGSLTEFWKEISRPDCWGEFLGGGFRRWFNTGSVAGSVLFGQPNFYTPRVPGPYISPTGGIEAPSFYDTSPLRRTLERLASFDLINSGPLRLTLGATRVTTGELAFFDNTREAIAPEHVIASGSLPPDFPGIRIGGELYWDGACVANTPLDAILEDEPDTPTLIFMIDPWDTHGPEPRGIQEVLWRRKQIQFASGTFLHIEAVAQIQNLRRALAVLAGRLSPELLDDPAVREAVARQYGSRMDIVHVVYHPGPDEVPQSDSEFSRPSIAARRAAGYEDMKLALEQAPWRREWGEDVGAVVHRVRAGRLTSRVPTLPQQPPAPTPVHA